MTTMNIDHVGIATQNAEELASLYVELFDCELVHDEEHGGMYIAFLDFGNGFLELLEPLEDAGAIAKYLGKNGPGMHHVAVMTEDIEAALDTASELGVELIDEEPRPGAWGHEVAFMHPRDTGGVLLEFVEH